MRKLFLFIIIFVSFFLSSCESFNAPASKTVFTGVATDITHCSANLQLKVSEEINLLDLKGKNASCVMIAKSKEEIVARTGERSSSAVLVGEHELWVSFEDLTPETKYFYCAVVAVNGYRGTPEEYYAYEYGEIESFTTLPLPTTLVAKTRN